MTNKIRQQYETYPYPPRNPADEAKRLLTGSPSHLIELNHYLFTGTRDFAKPFRALVAGGGTGDAAIMLAQQLADVGGPHEVVYLDISESSARIARDRASARQLDNIRFVRGSLLELPSFGLGEFDYIDCCGVLHHLQDPLAGLETLRRSLNDSGGIGLMLYAPLGRTGVYPVQDMLRMLVPEDTPEDQAAFARRFLTKIPKTNWFHRNSMIKDHQVHGDAGLYDLFLHSRDQAFYVDDIAQLVETAGLRLVTFVPTLVYDPALYLDDREILQRLESRSWLEKCAFAERLTGQMARHVFYVTKTDGNTTAGPLAPQSIPVFRDSEAPGGDPTPQSPPTLELAFGGVKGKFPLPEQAAQILPNIDGRRTLEQIHACLGSIGRRPGAQAPTFTQFMADFDYVYQILNGSSQLFLWQSSQTPPDITVWAPPPRLPAVDLYRTCRPNKFFG